MFTALPHNHYYFLVQLSLGLPTGDSLPPLMGIHTRITLKLEDNVAMITFQPIRAKITRRMDTPIGAQYNFSPSTSFSVLFLSKCSLLPELGAKND
ncbi:Hypothetical protein NTJ_07400 [Nesidiocoris tenuis]|uniref:Uncharacterized protein n=1 Tax=Nesidiocoris tenuis TaxID=355587 RepID=A0ABN7AUN2_9HEMI|nr:Hypothetical protein NTJ_07400 [Nesidiocoris tenuis]